jgi:hypothetical protein
MADGYARASGRPGVAFVITGPGLTNTITAMAQARADSVPMLVISGVNALGSLGKGLGFLHELPDQRGMMEKVALSSRRITVSTSGRSPALSGWLRDRLADEVGPEYETLVEQLAEAREALAATGERRRVADWRRALDSGMLDDIRVGHPNRASDRLRAALHPDGPASPDER